ncbi:hypothetical protein AB0M87_21200 [Streptomyces sp. NPDC051320]|uniref:hypothetical protein n=1 Tax=Streptomyces sp. NPDC051320 TaxID=3154644 RepID=UPI0034155BE7
MSDTPQYQYPGPYHQPQPGFPTPPPASPTRKPSRKKALLTHGAVACVALLIGTGIGSSGNADADTKAAGSTGPQPKVTVTETAKAHPAPTVTKTAKPKAPKKKAETGPADSFSGDGEYLVGEDIKAGTYKSAGSDDGFGCYWARLKNASGEFDAIIANDNLQGPGRVTLNKGEYFKTQRCQDWKRVG